MYRTNSAQHLSIGHDLMTFGNEGIATHRAAERRTTEIERDHLNLALHASRPTPRTRRWLGTMMIALGTGISGKAAQIQEREATIPAPLPEVELAPSGQG